MRTVSPTLNSVMGIALKLVDELVGRFDVPVFLSVVVDG
jgi:hypothetical protein